MTLIKLFPEMKIHVILYIEINSICCHGTVRFEYLRTYCNLKLYSVVLTIYIKISFHTKKFL